MDLDELATAATGTDEDVIGAGAVVETSEILAFFFLGSWTGREDFEAGVDATDGEGAVSLDLGFEAVAGATSSAAATTLDFLARGFFFFSGDA